MAVKGRFVPWYKNSQLMNKNKPKTDIFDIIIALNYIIVYFVYNLIKLIYI